jgi:uncharacterized protein (DUF488 family)
MSSPAVIFTIGHSTHAIENFVALLKQHGVTAVADVRSAPYSRFNPQFNREDLKCSLKDENIDYVFLGKELGARSDDPSCYVDGRVSYSRLAESALFRSGLDRVRTGRKTHRVALMCAEKEPLDCHRTILVSRALVQSGETVAHILANGRLESYAQSEQRLLELTGVPREDLFRSATDLLDEAYARQEQRIAYREEDAVSGMKEKVG